MTVMKSSKDKWNEKTTENQSMPALGKRKTPSLAAGNTQIAFPATKSVTYGSLRTLASFSEKQNTELPCKHTMEGQGDRENFSNLEAEGQPSISFADQGIPSVTQIQDTFAGKARAISSISWWEKSYVLCMVGSIVATSVITIYRVATVSTHSADFTFGLVLLLNAGFCLWYVVDGVWRERPTEIAVLLVATVIILIYIIINYAAGVHNDVKLARLIIACIVVPVLCIPGGYFAYKYHTEQFIVFRTVGANEGLQKRYSRLLAFQDLLKFDLQLGGSMIILIVVSQASVDTKDIVILAVGGPFTIAWFVLGIFSMPKEWKIGVWIFFAFSPAEIAYICYKLYDVSTYIDAFPGVAGATIACGVVALLFRGLVILLGHIVYKNFGSGLKEILNPPRQT